MPYIQQKDRKEIADGRKPNNAGELNYAITRLIMDYLYRGDGIYTYKDLNDVMGAVEGAKLEFYRRVAAPYEDNKIKENGDAYHR